MFHGSHARVSAKDIVRLERLKQDRVIHHGMAALLTNDHRYWQPARSQTAVAGSRFDAFRFGCNGFPLLSQT